MARTRQDVQTLTERPHWTVESGLATFAPAARGWRATVAALHDPTGTGRFHVAIIDRTGTTRFVSEATTLADAARRAEQGVLARNALRLATQR
jgi:hypothetical protein